MSSRREFNTNIMVCLHATSLKKNITKAWFQNTILWPMVKFIEQKNMKRASSKSRTRKTLGRKRPKNPLGWKRVAIDENDKVEPQQKNTLFGWHNQNKNNKKRNSEETKFPKHKKKHKTNKSGDSQRQWQHVGETCQESGTLFNLLSQASSGSLCQTLPFQNLSELTKLRPSKIGWLQKEILQI